MTIAEEEAASFARLSPEQQACALAYENGEFSFYGDDYAHVGDPLYSFLMRELIDGGPCRDEALARLDTIISQVETVKAAVEKVVE